MRSCALAGQGLDVSYNSSGVTVTVIPQARVDAGHCLSRCKMAHRGATRAITGFAVALVGFMLGIGLLGAGALARKPYPEEDLEARTMDHLKGHSEEFRRLHAEAEVRILPYLRRSVSQGPWLAFCLPVASASHAWCLSLI